MTSDDLRESWDILVGALERRSCAGFPVRVLTLYELEKFPGAEDRAELEEVDAEYVQRAQEIVEEIVDKRS